MFGVMGLGAKLVEEFGFWGSPSPTKAPYTSSWFRQRLLFESMGSILVQGPFRFAGTYADQVMLEG